MRPIIPPTLPFDNEIVLISVTLVKVAETFNFPNNPPIEPFLVPDTI